MNNVWDHLPNAKHIDLVIASVKANPNEWYAARDAAWSAARDVARDAARDAARTAARDVARDAARDAARTAARDVAWTAAWDAAWDAARTAAWDAAWDAIAALIAHDDCGHMLDSEPDDLRILSKLGSDAATLMIPAAIAFKLIRQKQSATVDT